VNPTPADRRDLNGKPVQRSRFSRLRDRFGASDQVRPLHVDDPDLIVVAESADEAQASSAALASTAWRPDDEVVLRHVLRVPAAHLDDVSATAALDGYVCEPLDAGDPVTIAVARVQLIDAMHLSQERSRMASLGSRRGGHVVGWQVLQRAPRR